MNDKAAKMLVMVSNEALKKHIARMLSDAAIFQRRVMIEKLTNGMLATSLKWRHLAQN